MRFNVNDYVLVRLTEVGRRIHRERHEDLSRRTRFSLPYIPPVEDENGWSKWQLWDLMSVFGPYTHLGGPNPFELTIEIPVSELSN